jgi:hypothetical protein
MKYYFKPTLLVLGLLLFTFSCQKNDQFEDTKVAAEIQAEKTIYFETLHKHKITQKYKDLGITVSQHNTRVSSQRLISASNDAFIIDDSEAQIIEQDNGSTTFSFFVYRATETPFVIENYVYQSFPNGDYAQYLISFTYELNAQGNKTYQSTNSSITLIDDDNLLLSRSSGCVPEIVDAQEVTVCGFIGCTGGSSHLPGEEDQCACYVAANNCDPYNWECRTSTAYTYEDCSSGGRDDYNDTEQPGGGTNNGSGSGINFIPPKENPSPVYEDILNCLRPRFESTNEERDGTEALLAQLNMAQWGEMSNYLTDNECSDEARDFVDLALDEGGKVDFEDQIILDQSFNNNQKAKCVYELLKQIDSAVFSKILESFDNNKEARLTLKVGNVPLVGLTPEAAKTLPKANGPNFIRTFDLVLDAAFIEHASLMEIAAVIVHEAIHAEIFERCIQLGIISQVTYDSSWVVYANFSNGQVISSNFSDLLFATLIDQYSSYGGGSINPNWQHDIFAVAGYKERISADLAIYYELLDDSLNPFENNLNNGTIIDVKMEEYFDLLLWASISQTPEYKNLNPLELTKLSQIKNQTDIYYNHDCN